MRFAFPRSDWASAQLKWQVCDTANRGSHEMGASSGLGWCTHACLYDFEKIQHDITWF